MRSASTAGTPESGDTPIGHATGKLLYEASECNNPEGLAAMSGLERSLALLATASSTATGYARKDGDDAYSI